MSFGPSYIWCAGYWILLTYMHGDASGELERTGTVIGGMIGFNLLLELWLIGAILLGILVLVIEPKYK